MLNIMEKKYNEMVDGRKNKMAKLYLICGKICSGKTYYSNILKAKLNAVILSPDEATYDLIQNEQGEFYNIFCERVLKYLNKKAV